MMRRPTCPTQTWRTFLRNHAIGMTEIDVLKACNSTLHQFCRFAILQRFFRWTSLIRSELSSSGTAFSSEETSTVMFDGYDRPAKHSVQENYETGNIEDRPSIPPSGREHPLLRFSSTRFCERGPPGKGDWNLTNDERETNRITASAA